MPNANTLIDQFFDGPKALSSPVYCTKCGASNQAESMFCSHCGAPLTQAAVPNPAPAPAQPMTPAPYPTTPPASTTPPPPFSPYPAHDYYTQMQQRDFRTQVDRTKTGLLLLMIGLILASLPFVSFIGGLLDLIGAILVLLGRKAFGSIHARNTIISLVLFIVGIVAVVVGAISFTFGIIGAAIANQNGATIDQTTVINGVNIFLVTIVVAAIFQGLATVLFTYALQKQTGRILLWVGYAASLAISLFVAITIIPQITNAVTSAFSSGAYNPTPVQDLQSEATAIQVLGIIPAVIYAVSFYLARERIERGELPAPQQPMAPAPSPLPTGY